MRIPYRPSGGVNYYPEPYLLGESEVADSRNFLFERGKARVRPGLIQKTRSGASVVGQPLLFASADTYGYAPFPLLVCHNSSTGFLKLYYVYESESFHTTSEITGANVAGTKFLTPTTHPTLANGAVLLAVGEKIVNIDPLALTYTLISQSYHYVTTNISRAVAGYEKLGADGFRQIGWSQAGSVTSWTGDGSGVLLLSDARGPITGLTSLKNVVVVGRRKGFHLGYNTGVSTPALRFEVFSHGDGAFPGTLVSSNDCCYFANYNGAFKFDLHSFENIGLPIRDLISREALGWTLSEKVNAPPYPYLEPIGFLSSSYGPGGLVHTYYNLLYQRVKVDPWYASNSNNLHFLYDLDEKVWSVCDYGSSMIGGGTSVRSSPTDQGGGKSGLMLVSNDSPPSIFSWDDSIPCERGGYLLSRTFVIGSEEDEWKVTRLLLKYKNFGASTVTITIECDLSGELIQQQFQLAIGLDVHLHRWLRKWVNPEIRGNSFTIRVDVPENQRFEVGALNLTTEDTPGEFRELL